MVAAPVNDAGANVGAAAQAAMAQAEKRTMWAPRTGLTDAYDDWKHDILLRLARLGFNSFEELLAWLPPTQAGTAKAQIATGGSVTRSRAGDAATDTDEAFSARLEWYQRVNSEVFDVIAPSLILEGTHKSKDRDTLRKFVNGPIRDGRGLLEWALTWTALDSFDTQSALLSSLYGPLAYVPVRKAASEAIWVNMRHWARTLNISCSVYEPEAEPDDEKRCAFTFVRDPLARFASGFAELEYLFRKGQYQQRFSRGDPTDWRADFVGWEFTRHRVGTPERAAAFVRDLLALRWLRPRPQPAIAGGLDHVFSNVGAIKRREWFASSCVIVGRVERLETDWPTMLDVCRRRGAQLAPFPFNQSLGSHVSSQWPSLVNSKRNMLALVNRSAAYWQALCLILLPDYELLRKLLPYGEAYESCERVRGASYIMT